MVALESTHIFQHRSQLSRIIELDQTSHGPVVAPPNELLADPNGRNAGPSHKIRHFGPNGLTIGVGIQLDDRVLGTERIQDLLGLDTKGSTGI